jgi:hypothetical protein
MKILVVVGNDEQREVCKGNNLNFWKFLFLHSLQFRGT